MSPSAISVPTGLLALTVAVGISLTAWSVLHDANQPSSPPETFVVDFPARKTAVSDEAVSTAKETKTAKSAPPPPPGSQKTISDDGAACRYVNVKGTTVRLQTPLRNLGRADDGTNGGDACVIYPTAPGHFSAACKCPAERPSTATLWLRASFRTARPKVVCTHGCVATEVNVALEERMNTRKGDTSMYWRITFTPQPCADGNERPTSNPGAKAEAADINGAENAEPTRLPALKFFSPTFITEVRFDVFLCDTAELRNQSELCFTTVGDWGAATANWARVSGRMTDAIVARPQVSFMVSTGDNFYPTGVRSVTDAQWSTAFEQPLRHSVLQGMRFYAIAGNHDQWGLPAQLEYGQQHPRWYFPRRYYVEEVPLPSYFALSVGDPAKRQGIGAKNNNNNNNNNQSSPLLVMFALDTHGRDFFGKQVAWLEDELSKYVGRDNTWKVVLGHVPIFSGSHHRAEKLCSQVRKALLPIFRSHGVHAYINGDDHVLEIHENEDTRFFVSGGGGGSHSYASTRLPQTVYFDEGGRVGFMLHCIRRGGGQSMVMHTDVIDGLDGSVLFAHDTPFSARRVKSAVALG